MHTTWLDPNQPDARDLAEVVALLADARMIDVPFDLAPTVSSYTGQLRCGWDGDAPQVALMRDDKGTACAVVEVSLPTWDNKHVGFVSVTVDPAARRRGIGRDAFAVGVEQVAAARRTLLWAECLSDGPGVAFLEAMGLQRASLDVWRRQNLRELNWALLDSEYRQAELTASRYELVRIPVPVPAELIAAVCEMTQAINDAPRDDLEMEDEVFTAERLRAFERAQVAQGRRIYRLAARERSTGTLAGHTVVAVEADRPWHAAQYDTSVLGAHRGHRLGALLKIGMLRWLATDEPQVRRIDTWNAASNDHMIAINELLGYHVLATGITWQRRL